MLSGTKVGESERAIIALRQENADKTAALETARGDMEIAIQTAEEQVGVLEAEQLEQQTRHEKDIANAKSSLENSLNTAETRLLEQEKMISVLKSSMSNENGAADAREEIERMAQAHDVRTACQFRRACSRPGRVF